MTITTITPQVRHVGRFSIFIDDKFSFGVSAAQLADFGLHQNLVITEQKLREFERRLDFDAVKRSALRSLELRMNSEGELRQKLKRKEFDPALIDDVVDWLKMRGLIDDKLFTERWIESRKELQGLGDFRLKQELFKKGIDRRVVDEVLEAGDEAEEDQVRRASRWAARHYKSQLSSLDEQPVKTRVMSGIVRRGFSYGIAKAAIEQISAERDD